MDCLIKQYTSHSTVDGILFLTIYAVGWMWSSYCCQCRTAVVSHHQAANHYTSACSASSAGWEKVIWKKTCGWDKNQLNERKAKASCGSKRRKNYSVLPINRQCPATFWEAGAQYTWQLLQKTNTFITNAPSPFLVLNRFFLLSLTSHGMSHPLGQFGTSPLAMSP